MLVFFPKAGFAIRSEDVTGADVIITPTTNFSIGEVQKFEGKTTVFLNQKQGYKIDVLLKASGIKNAFVAFSTVANNANVEEVPLKDSLLVEYLSSTKNQKKAQYLTALSDRISKLTRRKRMAEHPEAEISFNEEDSVRLELAMSDLNEKIESLSVEGDEASFLDTIESIESEKVCSALTNEVEYAINQVNEKLYGQFNPQPFEGIEDLELSEDSDIDTEDMYEDTLEETVTPESQEVSTEDDNNWTGEDLPKVG